MNFLLKGTSFQIDVGYAFFMKVLEQGLVTTKDTESVKFGDLAGFEEDIAYLKTK